MEPIIEWKCNLENSRLFNKLGVKWNTAMIIFSYPNGKIVKSPWTNEHKFPFKTWLKYENPTIQQAIQYIFKKWKIWINVNMDYSYSSDKHYYFYKIKHIDEMGFLVETTGTSETSPEKAYQKGIEFTLKNLIK
ncbi:MAG TPA: hypothetical protein PKD00_11335 [Burkholderiales bacterium]|nr:hypothetical protein [Burkholderiales bacterium]